MTTSLAQIDCSVTSSNLGFSAQDIGTLLPDTVTLTNTGSSVYAGSGLGGYSSGSTITISNGGNITGAIGTGSTFTISGAGSAYEWSQNLNQEWTNSFPDFDRIQKMCEEYPGLKIAFEKFKTTYKLVKDHYDTPEDQRPLP
jgi:hypothetical protein